MTLAFNDKSFWNVFFQIDSELFNFFWEIMNVQHWKQFRDSRRLKKKSQFNWVIWKKFEWEKFLNSVQSAKNN